MAVMRLVTVSRSDGRTRTPAANTKKMEANRPTTEMMSKKKKKNGTTTYYHEASVGDSQNFKWRAILGGLLIRELLQMGKTSGKASVKIGVYSPHTARSAISLTVQ